MRVLSTDSALIHGFLLGPWSVRPQEGTIERAHEQQRLGPRQMDLLVFLADQRQRVVGKEEIFGAVWRHAAVEDGALARCISELRRLLGDDARNPTFIATLPRRGYRLVAPVEVLEDEASTSIQSINSLEVDPQKVVAPEAGPGSCQETTGWPWKAKLTLASILLANLLLASFQSPTSSPSPSAATTDRPSDRFQAAAETEPVASTERIAVLGFENLSNRPEDDWLSQALVELLAAEIAASPGLQVLPHANVAANARRFLQSGTYTLSSQSSRRRLHQSLGSELVVFGSYLSLGADDGPLRLDVWIERRDAEEPLIVLSETSEHQEVLALVQRIGVRLRRALGLKPLTPTRDHSAALSLALHPGGGSHLYHQGFQCSGP